MPDAIQAPRITVVTPSYNQAEYLEQTILSVLDQAYPNLEYFIMDGGSTDGSADIIRKYEDRLDGWVSEKDRGQSDAINKGLRRATGELVTWLCSDDVYMPGALHAVGDAYREQPADVIYGDYTLITASGIPFLTRKEIPFDWFVMLYGVNFIGQPSSFFRRNLYGDNGPLDEELEFAMDYEMFLRFAHGGATFRHIKEVLSLYRYHPSSKTVAQGSGYWEEFEAVRDRFRTPPSPAARWIRNKLARAKRQWIKLRYRGTIDWFGGPLSKWLYQRAEKKGARAG